MTVDDWLAAHGEVNTVVASFSSACSADKGYPWTEISVAGSQQEQISASLLREPKAIPWGLYRERYAGSLLT